MYEKIAIANAKIEQYTCLVSVLCPSLVTCLLLTSLKRIRLKAHTRPQFQLEKTKLPPRNRRAYREYDMW